MTYTLDVFTCIPLFPFILPLSRYSMNSYFKYRLGSKMFLLKQVWRGGQKMFFLLSSSPRCNMWFSSTGQLLDNSLDFCSRLQNPLSLNGLLPQYSDEVQTADRASHTHAWTNNRFYCWNPPIQSAQIKQWLRICGDWMLKVYTSMYTVFCCGWFTIIPYIIWLMTLLTYNLLQISLVCACLPCFVTTTIPATMATRTNESQEWKNKYKGKCALNLEILQI